MWPALYNRWQRLPVNRGVMFGLTVARLGTLG